MPELQNDPELPWPVKVGIDVGAAYGEAAQTVSAIGAVPAWAQKAGAYLTDKGTLIRIGVFALGGVMVITGVLLFARAPIGKAVTTVGKAVI